MSATLSGSRPLVRDQHDVPATPPTEGEVVAFLVPFLDLGIEQSPRLQPEVSTLAHYLLGYGASRVLYDAALTPSFDETTSLVIALAWLAGLLVTATVLLRRLAPGGHDGRRA